MAPAKAANNAQYCKKYRQKNLEEIRKNDREKEVSKGVPKILRTKEVRGISQKRKGKKTKRYVPRLSNCIGEDY